MFDKDTAEEIIHDLASMNPLSLKSVWLPTTPTNTVVYGTNYCWVCQFCHRERAADKNYLGYVLPLQDPFIHDIECVWNRAVIYEQRKALAHDPR